LTVASRFFQLFLRHTPPESGLYGWNGINLRQGR
jgi:hypothetical protein